MNSSLFSIKETVLTENFSGQASCYNIQLSLSEKERTQNLLILAKHENKTSPSRILQVLPYPKKKIEREYKITVNNFSKPLQQRCGGHLDILSTFSTGIFYRYINICTFYRYTPCISSQWEYNPFVTPVSRRTHT